MSCFERSVELGVLEAYRLLSFRLLMLGTAVARLPGGNRVKIQQRMYQ